MIKIDRKYDLEKIQEEVMTLLCDYTLVGRSQLLLQSIDGNNWDDIRAPYHIDPDLRETDYRTPNTPEDWELTKFMIQEGVCRTRLLRLKSRECYTWHKDVGDRVHLAVRTTDKCFFIEHEQMQHIPADGYPYMLNVDDYHTAMNCSTVEFNRIHIVGVIR